MAVPPREIGSLGLTGGLVGGGQHAVGGSPNASGDGTRLNEQAGGDQGDEGQEQCVLDQILSLVFFPEILDVGDHRRLSSLRAPFLALHPVKRKWGETGVKKV